MEGNCPKTYRIARFQSLRMIDAAAEQPEEFNLDEYFGNAWCVFRGKESFDVEIEFTPDAASLVTETCWHKTQEIKRPTGWPGSPELQGGRPRRNPLVGSGMVRPGKGHQAREAARNGRRETPSGLGDESVIGRPYS